MTQRKFLVVDDDALVRDSIQMMLENTNAKVDLARDGVEGVEMFKANTYDIIIVDIIMPEKAGFETIKEILEIDKDAEIIAISGGTRDNVGSYLPIASELGAKAIIYKPFNEEELYHAINKIVGH